MGDLREVRRLVAEVEAPSPEPEPLYPLASSVDASSASAAAAALFPEKGTLRLRGGGEGAMYQYCAQNPPDPLCQNPSDGF